MYVLITGPQATLPAPALYAVQGRGKKKRALAPQVDKDREGAERIQTVKKNERGFEL